MIKLVVFTGLLLFEISSWCLENYSIDTGQDVFQLDVSPNQEHIAVGLETKIQLYNYQTMAAGCSYSIGGVIRSLKFLPSSDKFAFGLQIDDLEIITVTNTATCSFSKSLATGHGKVLGIDFNLDGSKMLTCGEDKTFRVWDMTATNPTVIGGGNFDLGEVALSCKLSFDQYAGVGIIGNVVKIFSPPNYVQSGSFSQTFNIPGHADRFSFFNCDRNKYIMGSDNGGFYSWNNLNYYLHTGTHHVRLATVDPTDDFIAIGKQNYQLNLIQSSDYSQYQRFNMASKVFSGDFVQSAEVLVVGLQDHFIKFFRRCGCPADTPIYNSTYCPIRGGFNRLCQPYIPPNSNNSTNSTNATDNSTNMTNNSTNVTNSSNVTQLLNNYTIQQFFSFFFTYGMVFDLTPRTDLQITTETGIICNTLNTTIKLTGQKCSSYFQWKEYIRLIHPKIAQLKIYCRENEGDTMIIESLIKQDIEDPEGIYVILPKSQYIQSVAMPSLDNWKQIFSKINAGYRSLTFLALYQDSECQKMKSIENYLIAVFAITTLMLIIGIMTAKIVGLEMFGILQIAYFALACHGSININLSPIVKFHFFNGLNLKIQKQNDFLLPNSFAALGVSSQFLNNFNVMGFISLFILGALLFVAALQTKFQNNGLTKFFMRICKESLITFVVFNSLNIGFSAGVHLKHSKLAEADPIFQLWSDIFLIITFVSLLLAIIIFECSKEKQVGQFKRKFKDSFVNKSYISFKIVFRLAIGFYLAYKNEEWETTLFAIGAGIFVVFYFLVNLPFKHYFQNYRAFTIHISFLIILLVSNYYRSMKLNTQTQVKSRLHSAAILELVVIGISVSISFIVLAFEIFKSLKFYLNSKNRQKVTQESVNKTTQQLCQQGEFPQILTV